MKKFAAGLAVFALVVALAFVFEKKPEPQADGPAASNLGTYPYVCDQGVRFTLTIASDVQSVEIRPVDGQTFPPQRVLLKNPSASDLQFIGKGMMIAPKGETLTFTEGPASIRCAPAPDQENAPFNFGD